jgi:hypothetical protein
MTTRFPFAVGNPSTVRPRRIPSARSVVLTRYTADAAARAARARIAVANPALISSLRERESIGVSFTRSKWIRLCSRLVSLEDIQGKWMESRK